ncbi:MAG: hypothetical protein NC339_03045 [Muribaculaceae bacterium]|nr:hypothetical protein [Muribaculaceae bacterium]
MSVLLAGLSFTACNSDDEDPIPFVAEFSKTSLTFNASGAPDQLVEVYTNADYFAVSATESWCIVQRGDTRGQYVIGCTVNNSTDARSCTVKVTIDGLDKATMAVTQAGSKSGIVIPDPVE